MHLLGVAQVLAVIVIANGVPVLARKFLRDRYGWPLDGGLVLSDGHRLFGRSKTVRGIVLSIVAGIVLAPLFGLGADLGAGIAACAMAGDLFSSFCKRRLGMESSSQALGLDQVPESLLPLLWSAPVLGFGAADILLGVVVFLVGELAISRLLFRLHIRERPY
ncbi:MAG: CDP-archaeol synthase [Proteobacteria bacterium]|nr:CDP-archaeol synthase [Pseudomonadota bacterium]